MTHKQAKAIQLMTENHGNASKAMREAGYSPNTYKKPSNLTRSEAYKQAVEQGILSDGIDIDAILAPVRKALKAQTKRQVGSVVTETDEKGNPTQHEYIFEEEDNIPLQLQGHDRAVKLLGLDKIHEKDPDTPEAPSISSKDFEKAIKSGNTVELQRIIFSSGT